MDDAVADDNISILKQLAPEWTNDEIHLLVKKYDHDLDKAANALLSDENIKDTLHLIPATQVVIPSHREVIDLTTDDTEEMTRALQMSMEANNVQTTRAVTFGPSNRPPDADWAMTLSSSNDPPAKNLEDQQMEEAVKLSMEAFHTTSDDDSKYLSDTPIPTRDPSTGRPLLLMAEQSKCQWAALLVCALVKIPQVQLALREIANGLDTDEISDSLLQVIMFAAHQDHVHLEYFIDQGPFNRYKSAIAASDIVTIRDYAQELLTEIFTDIETNHARLNKPEQLRLAKTNIKTIDVDFNGQISAGDVQVLPANVNVDFGHTEGRDDLHQIVFGQMFIDVAGGMKCTSICPPSSEVYLFKLMNMGRSADVPVFPETIYMDKFMIENFELMCKKLEIVRSLDRERKSLREKRQALTRFNNQDTLKDMKTTLYYYENVAQGSDDPQRRARIDTMVTKLKNCVKVLEEEVLGIEKESTKLLGDSLIVFDGPELKQHPYVLRAVLASSGPPTRGNLYSYFQDAQTRWWKTVDNVVTEVPREDVFNDSSGVLLGAGPYMLLYSREMPNTKFEEWPDWLTQPIYRNNELYARQLQSKDEGTLTRDISMADLTGVV